MTGPYTLILADRSAVRAVKLALEDKADTARRAVARGGSEFWAAALAEIEDGIAAADLALQAGPAPLAQAAE